MRIGSTKKLYIIISLFFLLLLILCSWILQRDYIRDEKKTVAKNIFIIAALLEAELEGTYNDILLKNNSLKLNDKRKTQIINKELQPIINKISKVYPGYGMGFYSIELDSVVAIGPDFESILLKRVSRIYPYFKSYVTGKPEYSYSGTSIAWYGKSIYNVTYPIYRDAKIIGHTWANKRLDDIYTAARSRTNKIHIGGLIVLIIVLLILRLTIYFFKKQLHYIFESLINDKKVTNLNIISEVQPIVDKIKEERDLILEHEREIAKLERFHTIGEMSATLAHEVRNPLSTIDGYIQLLKTKSDNTYVNNKLNVISKEVVRINSIISEYLSFSRDKDSGKESNDINSLIKSMEPLVQSDANKRRKSVFFDLENVPEFEMNEREIRQLIFNISRNGLEAMNEGGTLTIKTYQKEGKVILSISDEGHGIPNEIIDKINKPFFTTKNNGTGLGLSVCYRIVEQHNGNIDIETSESGTTFKINFNCNNGK